jgi:hypothetical protein
MRKIIFLSIIVISMVSGLFSQNPYYDALQLEGKAYQRDDGKISFKLKDSLFISAILKKYAPGEKYYAGLITSFHSNPFIALPVSKSMSSANPFDISKLTSGAGALSAIGGLDVTNLADGFAKFLVKRTKEELNVAFFERLQRFLEKYKDAQLLFPQTYLTLQAIGTEIYNYEIFISSLRESFEKDLNGLLANLPNVINNSDYDSFFRNHGELKDVCLSSIWIGNCLLNKENPGQIIANYDPDSLLANHGNNVKAAVKVFQVFSESMRSAEAGHYWIRMDSLNALLNDNVAFQIYLGLIYQQIGDIRLDDKTYLKAGFVNNAETFGKVRAYLRGFMAKASIVSENIKNISGKEKDKVSFTDYYNFYSVSLDLIQYAANAYQLPGLMKLKPPEDFNKYVMIARTGGNIALDINRKNYSSAIINSYTLYNYAFGGGEKGLNGIISNPAKSKEEKDYATSILNDRNSFNKTIEDFKMGLLKYGPFIASVSQAQNSDDVEKAIEAAALPSGSSRIKRETSFNVSLNAYTGLFVGHETIVGLTDNQFINNYGITAPIGVALSTGSHSFLFLCPKNEGHWSYSLFVSLIDLGAVASFRFQNNDSVSQIPTIHLQDIFSPGIFLSVGIPKCPLSVNMGVQMGPNLRKVYVEDKNNPGEYINGYENSVYWRYSLSLVVDIPVFNLYTKSKN